MKNTTTNISLVTYTNSVMHDAWDIYFGQLDKYCNLKSFVFSDQESEKYKNHTFIKYDNDSPYWIQYTGGLDRVDDEYVIYMQEDFFLYDSIDMKKIETYVDFLKNTDYSFVRLIRAGYKTPLDNHVVNDLYEVDVNTNDAFSMQATLWKKSKIRELYDYVKSEKWYEGDHWNNACRELSIRGVLTYNGEEQRARYHYDSSVFPYACTAINKGRWNMHIYNDFLLKMFDEYNIDPEPRGMRMSQSYFTK